MKKFQEYKNNRDKVVTTPIVRTVADKVEDVPGDRKNMPPKSGWGSVTSKDNGNQPYSPNGSKKIVKASGKGLGDQGSCEAYDVTKKRNPAKIPTAEARFAYQELLPKIRSAIKAYPPITENLIRELQRDNLLGVLVGEMLSHNETYLHIAEVMASKNHGQGVCRKLAKAMREGVAPPWSQRGDQMDTTSGGVDPALGLGTGPTDGQGGDDEFNDDDMNVDSDDEFGDMDGDDDFGDDDMGGDEEGRPSIGLGGDDMGAEDPMAKIKDLEDQLAQLKAQVSGDASPESGDEFGLGGDDEGGEDPYAPGMDAEPDMGADPNAVGPDGQPLPPPVGPDGQPLPPNPNQPPIPPRPMGPPAMENMRRAMRSVFENYQPLAKKRRIAKK